MGDGAVEIDAVLAEYLDACASGADVDLEHLCERYPELADELRLVVPVLQSLNRSGSRGTDTALESVGDSTVTAGLMDLIGDIRDDPADAARGATPRYDVEKTIGRGGMGEVVRVFDRDLERHLAMKRSLGDPPSAVLGAHLMWLRFLKEARLTGGLEHPGIVPVHEVGTHADGRPYFTMRLVRGRELQEVLERESAGDDEWPQARVLGVIAKVCEAVAYAHDRGVVHRDLKPSNVMVGEFGEVYVMDWGIARRVDDANLAGRRGADEHDHATLQGTVLGTPCYMPPEQARGEIDLVDFRSDVYSVGAILYQLLAGCPPYLEPAPDGVQRDDSPLAVIDRVRAGPPAPLERVARDAPTELVAIAEQAMARDPRARYADMGELAEDLRAYLEHRVVRAYRTGAVIELRKWIRRNRTTAAAIAFAFLAVVAGLVASLALFAEAQAARETAEREREGVLRLSALRDLDRLHARAENLWPVTAGSVAPLAEWLRDLETLEGDVEPSRALLRDLESGAVAQAIDARSREWWIESAGAFLVDMETIQDPDSGLAGHGAHVEYGLGIRARLAIATRLRDELADGEDWARRWDAARAELLSLYGDFELGSESFADLVPMGADADTGLMEFWHVASGTEPERGPDGALVIGDATGLVLVLIPEVEGLVGAQFEDPSAAHHDPQATREDGPVRTARCGPILVSKYEMTQGQWLRANGQNPSEFNSDRSNMAGGLQHPVETIRQVKCVSTLTRLGLRLPTMDEWELVARAGSTRPYCWYEDELPGEYANLLDGSPVPGGGTIVDGWAQTAPVGTYLPNAFGLHDVHGNVTELCTIEGIDFLVQRGGGLATELRYARASFHRSIEAEFSFVDLGVRPVRSVR